MHSNANKAFARSTKQRENKRGYTFGHSLPFAMLLLVLVAPVDHPTKVSDDGKDGQGDKDMPDKEPAPALVRFPLDQLTCSVDRLVATVVLTADLRDIGRRDGRIVLI